VRYTSSNLGNRSTSPANRILFPKPARSNGCAADSCKLALHSPRQRLTFHVAPLLRLRHSAMAPLFRQVQCVQGSLNRKSGARVRYRVGYCDIRCRCAYNVPDHRCFWRVYVKNDPVAMRWPVRLDVAGPHCAGNVGNVQNRLKMHRCGRASVAGVRGIGSNCARLSLKDTALIGGLVLCNMYHMI